MDKFQNVITSSRYLGYLICTIKALFSLVRLWHSSQYPGALQLLRETFVNSCCSSKELVQSRDHLLACQTELLKIPHGQSIWIKCMQELIHNWAWKKLKLNNLYTLDAIILQKQENSRQKVLFQEGHILLLYWSPALGTSSEAAVKDIMRQFWRPWRPPGTKPTAAFKI